VKILRVEGIITALITPLNSDGDLCVECLKELIEFQYRNGVSGLYLTGTYGEGVVLPASVRLKVFEKTLEYASSSMYLLPHIGSSPLDVIVDLGKKLRDIGYKEISIVGPIYHKPSRKGLAEFYNYIASKTELNILIYNNPGRQGYNITPDDFHFVVDRVKNVVGIKDTSRDVDQLLELVKRFGDRYFIAGGGDSFMFYTFIVGAPVHICGISNLIPEVAVALYKSVKEGSYRKALEIQFKLNQLRKILSKLTPETQEALRELMKRRNIRSGYPPIHLAYDLDQRLVDEAYKLVVEILEAIKT
jgi:dihydrodipicolinate synthase/N-acetylneuraminate lyase